MMSEKIDIVVKFFAMVRQTVGKRKMDLDIKKGTKVNELVEDLIEDYPELDNIREILIVSVNKKTAADDQILEDGDEVAIMPPVTGG